MVARALAEYFAALERLKASRPINVPPHTRISNDSVSMEAGRGRGSIKKSRPIFAELITAIDAACNHISVPLASGNRESLQLPNGTEGDLRQQLDEALGRELSLLRHVYALRKELSQLSGKNVLPIRKAESED